MTRRRRAWSRSGGHVSRPRDRYGKRSLSNCRGYATTIVALREPSPLYFARRVCQLAALPIDLVHLRPARAIAQTSDGDNMKAESRKDSWGAHVALLASMNRRR